MKSLVKSINNANSTLQPMADHQSIKHTSISQMPAQRQPRLKLAGAGAHMAAGEFEGGGSEMSGPPNGADTHLFAVPSTRSYPTPGLLMDIPYVKTGQQLYITYLCLFQFCSPI